MILRIFLLILCFTLSRNAFAGGDDVTVMAAAGDATELTQQSNNALLKESSSSHAQMLVNQSEMLLRQLTSLNDMVQNSKTVSNSNWSKTGNLLQDLARVVSQGQALSYAGQNNDAKFRQLYPGYSKNRNYSQDYRNWSDSSMDSIRGSMNSANLQANDFATEDSMINQLQHMSETNSGRMQALQTGNMIAVENVQQMRKLRQLQMAEMQAQNSYLATKQQESISQRAAQDSFFDIPDPTANRANKRFTGGSRR
jgi:P-type conjugative transfer protein TrbJ